MSRASVSIASSMGQPTPRRLRYSWLDTDDLESLPIRGGGSQAEIAIGGHAVSNRPAEIHELTHISVPLHSIPFLFEGLAVAFAPLIYESGAQYPLASGVIDDPRLSIGATTSAEVDYSVAGRFTMFLLARHGGNRFMSLYFALGRLGQRRSFAELFYEIYGVSLSDEVFVFTSAERYPYECDFYVQPIDCDSTAIVHQEGVWADSRVLYCDSEDVVGGEAVFADWRNFVPRSLEVAEGGEFIIAATGDPGAGVRLAGCSECPWQQPTIYLESGEERAVTLPAGRYYVRMSGPAGEAVEVGFLLKQQVNGS